MTSLDLPFFFFFCHLSALATPPAAYTPTAFDPKNFNLPSMSMFVSTCRGHSQTNNIKSGYYSTTSLLAPILTTGTWRIISLVEIYSNHARQPVQVHG